MKIALVLIAAVMLLAGLTYVEANSFNVVDLKVPADVGNYTHRFEIWGDQSGNSFYEREGYLDVTMKHWTLIDVLWYDNGGSLTMVNKTVVASGNKAHCQFPHWDQVGYSNYIQFTRGDIEEHPLGL